MVHGAELSIAKRAQIMLLHDMGHSNRKIAEQPQISYGGVYRSITRMNDRFVPEYKSRKRSGRPKASSATTDNSIILMAKRSPRASSAKIQSQLPVECKVSTRTIRRRLFHSGLKSHRPAKKPLLSKKNIRDRKTFCHKYRNWFEDQWENVLFSDESTFTQFYSFSGHVRRPIGKRNAPKYCTSAVKQCAKFMVWGAFSGKAGRGGSGSWNKAPQLMPQSTKVFLKKNVAFQTDSGRGILPA